MSGSRHQRPRSRGVRSYLEVEEEIERLESLRADACRAGWSEAVRRAVQVWESLSLEERAAVHAIYAAEAKRHRRRRRNRLTG